MNNISSTLATVWRIAAPYFRSEDKWPGRALLGAVISIELALVAIDVLLNQWQNRFYTGLQEKNWDVFVREMGVFCVLASCFIVYGPISVPVLPALTRPGSPDCCRNFCNSEPGSYSCMVNVWNPASRGTLFLRAIKLPRRFVLTSRRNLGSLVVEIDQRSPVAKADPFGQPAPVQRRKPCICLGGQQSWQVNRFRVPFRHPRPRSNSRPFKRGWRVWG